MAFGIEHRRQQRKHDKVVDLLQNWPQNTHSHTKQNQWEFENRVQNKKETPNSNWVRKFKSKEGRSDLSLQSEDRTNARINQESLFSSSSSSASFHSNIFIFKWSHCCQIEWIPCGKRIPLYSRSNCI